MQSAAWMTALIPKFANLRALMIQETLQPKLWIGYYFLNQVFIYYFLKEDFKIPMNNALVFSCYGHFYKPGSVNKLKQ